MPSHVPVWFLQSHKQNPRGTFYWTNKISPSPGIYHESLWYVPFTHKEPDRDKISPIQGKGLLSQKTGGGTCSMEKSTQMHLFKFRHNVCKVPLSTVVNALLWKIRVSVLKHKLTLRSSMLPLGYGVHCLLIRLQHKGFQHQDWVQNWSTIEAFS